MSFQRGVQTFAAWIDERGEAQAQRLRFSHTEHRRLLLKTEAAELEAIREAFYRFALEELSPLEVAFFLAGRTKQRTKLDNDTL